jgi:1,4-alpha-glucan branching enzyme
VLLTGESHRYYGDVAAAPIDHLVRTLEEGFAWQGQHSRYRDRARGEPSGHLPPAAFINFLQNHDQIGNRAFGERITRLAPADAVRAATCVLLLAPSPPLLFMGDEFGSHRPFPFFCSFGRALGAAVRAGRARLNADDPAFTAGLSPVDAPDPNDPRTFESAVLDDEFARGQDADATLAEFRTLLRIRNLHIVPRLAGMRAGARVERIGDRALRACWKLGDDALLTLLANLGPHPEQASSPAGQLLYGVPRPHSDGERLPPWSAGWWLEATTRGGRAASADGTSSSTHHPV